jgi:hypothetical protein
LPVFPEFFNIFPDSFLFLIRFDPMLLQIGNPIIQGDKILYSRAPTQEKNAGYKYRNTALHKEIDPLI